MMPGPPAGGSAGEGGRVLSPAGDPVGFQNSATGLDLTIYAAHSYSLRRPPRTGRRLIRLRERSATGRSGQGGRRWRLPKFRIWSVTSVRVVSTNRSA